MTTYLLQGPEGHTVFAPRLNQAGAHLRRVIQRKDDGLAYVLNGKPYPLRLIVSGIVIDGERWVHVSVSREDEVMPTWEDLTRARNNALGDVLCVQVLAPSTEHYTVQEQVPGTRVEIAHLWHNLDRRVTPDFRLGTGAPL